jgi:hypothetical protein
LPSPLFSSTICIPSLSFKTLSLFYDYKAEYLLNDYLKCAEDYLKSSFMQSLDKQACIELFWKYFPALPQSLTITNWEWQEEKNIASHKTFFEDASNAKALGCKNSYVIDWQDWFRQALIVDPVKKRAYRFKPGGKADDLCRVLHNWHQDRGYGRPKGNEFLSQLFDFFPDNFESYSIEEDRHDGKKGKNRMRRIRQDRQDRN